jgi:UDP-N-acetylmuramate dehydrogenase
MGLSLLQNTSLAPYHTFHIEVQSRYFCILKTIEQLKEIKNLPKPHLVLGGGSNILFLDNFAGTIIKNELKGREVFPLDDQHILLKVAAGENWQDIVQFSLDNNWGGMENLSLIPGTMGAAPIQNIGAYGVELKDIFYTLEAFHLQKEEIQTFTTETCEFAYRESVFKQKYKNQYLITSVTLKLTIKNHLLQYDYFPLLDVLKQQCITTPTIQEISAAVIAVRKSKLPDPNQIANAGSFFKNPIISQKTLKNIQKKYPQIPFYPVDDQTVKIPAAWLIEQGGWKGKTIHGRYGVHRLQPLVLVNYSQATGKEIINLAKDIIGSIQLEFDITLEIEVNRI